ncbi:ribonuclease domain-containing protein [Actinomadura atramentaria]|uniref:ribonuclease domain-containing protein n=1 Tax=Actinomadura atramentaria TaxID=1990 RepID=UPI000361E5D8|nr:ribonuclease domain-containing protein [Actinomadura atramentaria]
MTANTVRALRGALAAAVLLGAGACGTDGGLSAADGRTGVRHSATAAAPTRSGSLPEVSPDKLPKEAVATLKLIDEGGPFPYPKDGVVFQNRERILPREPRGYYHEYTVPTPHSKDRGARRLVSGKNGERYYSGDHYRSFVRVLWKGHR